MPRTARDEIFSWPVLHYPDGSVSILVPGWGEKRYSQEELAVACVEVLGRGDTETTVRQRLILERLCGPVRWQQVNGAVETADVFLADLAAM